MKQRRCWWCNLHRWKRDKILKGKKRDQDKLIADANSLSDKKLLLWLASRQTLELNALASTKLVDRVAKIIEARPELDILVKKFLARKQREDARKWYIKVHGAIVPGTENNVVPRVDMDKINKEEK